MARKEQREPVVNFGFRVPSAGDEDAPPGAAEGPEAAEASPPEPVSEAFRMRAERWKRELLDVTRRNRAINHRPSRATLALPASSDGLWDTLVVNEGQTSFSARNFAPDAASPTEDDRALAAFAATTRLAERARLADREQGIQVLFAALGWLDWVDAEGHLLRSPLVLVPVELAYDRQQKEVDIQAAADDPPEVNPSLAYLLHVQYGVRLPRLEDEEGEPLHDSLDAFLEAVAQVVAKQPGWSVEKDGAVVDVFAFAKLAMVDEIERSLTGMARHPILRALAGEGELPAIEAPSTPIDGRYAPGALRVVVEADAYQLEAVAMAASEASFVIEGPPGTGKSQTITNIAAELMAQGKRVLFVAEKRVAREVVLENLEKAGLAEACLHLASNAGATNRADAKAQVIKEIVDTLDAGPPPPQPDPAVPQRYAELRQRLNGYAEGIGQQLGEGGWITAFEVFGKAIETSGERRAVPVPPVAGTSRFWLEDAVDAGRDLDAFAADELACLAGPWVDLRWTVYDPASHESLRSQLVKLATIDVEIEALAGGALGPATGPAAALNLSALEAVVVRLGEVGGYRERAKSVLRFLNPRFYAASANFRRYLADGYLETGNEGSLGLRLRAQADAIGSALGVVEDAFGPAAPVDGPISAISAWASGLLPAVDRLPTITAMAAILKATEPLGMRAAFATLLADLANHGHMATVVPASAFGGWADQLIQAGVSLAPEQHARLIDAFGRLDSEMIGWARTQVLSTVRSNRPRSVNHRAMAPLVKYAHAKRRPALRTMLGNSREAVQLLKPTLLMSPLAAAQYLCHGDGATYRFDTVIVDEASMIPTPDMVVALSLAEQAIIVGDSRQMPPTNFFNKEISPLADDQSEEADVTFESILDEAAPLLSSTMLRAHYRSRDESLIAFSNVHFYDGRLIAFPDAWGDRPESGVRFEFVDDAVYGRGQSRANPAEAQRVIDVLRRELQASEGKRQVAITAMSLAQQSEILEQIEGASALDPLIRGWLEGGGLVRNLETVQGDESDVMLLSVGYGRDSEGRLILNFGPLGQEKGERRLNVAITRAKWKTVLVSSIRSGDIDPSRTGSVGTLRLRDYLDYAERGPQSLPPLGTNAVSPLSVFETAVIAAATASGLQCVPRVGVGGYRVDIAVRHPADPERFVLAIECDGPKYSGAPAARDRELGRDAVLTRMGWNVHRTFSASWYRNPEAELGRLLDRYRQATLG
ncbi:MAG: DUF4011 domain-containing protein [Dehalococcoidia bacterium]|nr:DUF4011 domain-containing protein [Dehalococcoidia bacterium]